MLAVRDTSTRHIPPEILPVAHIPAVRFSILNPEYSPSRDSRRRRITLCWMFLVFPVVFWAESPSTSGRTRDSAPAGSPRVTVRHKLTPIREYMRLRRPNRDPDVRLVAPGKGFATSAPRLFPPIIMVRQLCVACVTRQILPGSVRTQRSATHCFFHP